MICEVARAMLNEKNMPNHYWAEACATTVYVLNKTPTMYMFPMKGEGSWIPR